MNFLLSRELSTLAAFCLKKALFASRARATSPSRAPPPWTHPFRPPSRRSVSRHHELSRRQEGAPRERRRRHRPRHRRRPRLRQPVHAAHHPARARARGVLGPPAGRRRHGARRRFDRTRRSDHTRSPPGSRAASASAAAARLARRRRRRGGKPRSAQPTAPPRVFKKDGHRRPQRDRPRRAPRLTSRVPSSESRRLASRRITRR